MKSAASEARPGSCSEASDEFWPEGSCRSGSHYAEMVAGWQQRMERGA
jgi:hypothetical protein